MQNNPMQMIQMLSRLKNNSNPMGAMQALYGNNPLFQQAVQMAQGKGPEELNQTAMNLCKTNGVDFNQIINTVRNMGIPI